MTECITVAADGVKFESIQKTDWIRINQGLSFLWREMYVDTLNTIEM